TDAPLRLHRRVRRRHLATWLATEQLLAKCSQPPGTRRCRWESLKGLDPLLDLPPGSSNLVTKILPSDDRRRRLPPQLFPGGHLGLGRHRNLVPQAKASATALRATDDRARRRTSSHDLSAIEADPARIDHRRLVPCG